MVKESVLEEDTAYPELVASSVYSTNPVHYLIMVNEKDILNVYKGKTETIKFLRMNIIHDYNMTMVSVDQADQFQGKCCIVIGLKIGSGGGQ